jgi:hypothetical protein
MRPARPPAFFAGGAAESDIYKQQHCDCLAVARACVLQEQKADFLGRKARAQFLMNSSEHKNRAAQSR